MQFFVPELTKKKTKYFPRHFHALADHFEIGDWPEKLRAASPGNWAMVIRSPGYRGLGRSMAKQAGIDCVFDMLSQAELQFVKIQGGKILLDLGWEMLDPRIEVVTGLAETLNELDIDPRNVFIFHSNQNAREQFNRHWIDTAGTQPPYSLEYPVAVALCVVHQQKNRDDLAVAERKRQADHQTANDGRSQLFVSFNGEVRPHRLYMAAALETCGIFNRGYFSLIYPRKSLKETEDQFRERSLKLLNKLPRGREYTEAGSRILDRLPIELDIATVPPGGIEEIAWISQDPRYYDDSNLALVIDTAISDSTCLFVTEKVLKPVMNHTPFLLVGSAGGANLLRSYGFRTFEPYIRQCESGSFDDVLTQAVDEMVRLSKLERSELNELSRSLTDICSYNTRHFWEAFPDILKHKFQECLLALGISAHAS